MTSRLEEIKARAEKVAAKREDTEPTFAEFAAIIRLANFDVPALVATVEAVLALHTETPTRECRECTDDSMYVRPYPCPTVQAINTALGEVNL